MTTVLKVVPSLTMAFARAETTITSSAGPSYTCYCTRNLDFAICLGEELVLYGERKLVRHRRSRTIRIRNNSGMEFAVIRQSVLSPIGDKVMLGKRSYRIPTVCRPRIDELGLSFSRLGLFGLGSQLVHIHNMEHHDLGLALLGYLYAWDTFVGC